MSKPQVCTNHRYHHRDIFRDTVANVIDSIVLDRACRWPQLIKPKSTLYVSRVEIVRNLFDTGLLFDIN